MLSLWIGACLLSQIPFALSAVQRLRKTLLTDDEDLCSFEVFGSDEGGHAENEMTVASTSNTLFKSKSTLVVDRAGLRVMVFREEGSHGAMPAAKRKLRWSAWNLKVKRRPFSKRTVILHAQGRTHVIQMPSHVSASCGP